MLPLAEEVKGARKRLEAWTRGLKSLLDIGSPLANHQGAPTPLS